MVLPVAEEVKKKHQHWFDNNPQEFTKEQRAHTTILFGGLTILQDNLIAAGFNSLGYKVKALDCPDNAALQVGKEFGNRGQCNPTYYTVGNLIKYLIRLRDEEQISTENIIKNYVFLTSSACGPCRFGMYATEYRKALRDAGFEGFRVVSFKNSDGLNQSSKNSGIAMVPRFFITILKAIVCGDILNILGYRIRPYEIDVGSTDKALEQCRQIVATALLEKASLNKAMKKCHNVLNALKVDRTRIKPKVSIIGEFWAMTTEGDGNYRLQRFLEEEGAECDIQPVTNWILYLIWNEEFKVAEHEYLTPDELNKTKWNFSPMKKKLLMKLAKTILTKVFYKFAKSAGLTNYHLPDMDEIAAVSHQYYLNQLKGGEGHMEVGKLIQTVTKKKAHLLLSVKPFGCMPSSGVSDGVQSLITSKYPEANFLAIETSGDGATNVYSRIQMSLYKARMSAESDYKEALKAKNLEAAVLSKYQQMPALYYPPHKVASTTANLIYEIV